MSKAKNIDIYLGYLGAIPFLFFTICLAKDIKYTLIFGDTFQALSIYGLLISSFLAGSHWGKQINLTNSSTKILLQVSSNLNVIIIWFAYISLDIKYFLLLLVLEFLMLLKIDYHLYRLTLTTKKYFFCIRVPVTTIVVILLIISWSLI